MNEDQSCDKEAQRRLHPICDFEKLLTKSGTRILKFFLHRSKEEQKKRLLVRQKLLES